MIEQKQKAILMRIIFESEVFLSKWTTNSKAGWKFKRSAGDLFNPQINEAGLSCSMEFHFPPSQDINTSFVSEDNRDDDDDDNDDVGEDGGDDAADDDDEYVID